MDVQLFRIPKRICEQTISNENSNPGDWGKRVNDNEQVRSNPEVYLSSLLLLISLPPMAAQISKYIKLRRFLAPSGKPPCFSDCFHCEVNKE
mmetsp:Transcript_18303/g.26571  ORF Transcript_18303/g.26571 Transcript_18303/m.26571 type:complete len:92 (+) Transcript_18303:439-714(+)